MAGPGFQRELFDARDYLEHNPDVAASGADPYDHFLAAGLEQGRPARFFDATYYLRKNPDVLRAGLEPYAHYQAFGLAENRPSRFAHIRFEDGDPAADYAAWHAAHVRKRLAANAVALDQPAPPISVVMATRDSDLALLDRAIASVLSQPYRALELCIADDAPTDSRARERILRWAAVDARVKYVFRGCKVDASAAVNSAVALASGEYVAFMEPDAELAEGALASVGRWLGRHPDCLLLYSDEDEIDDQGALGSPHLKPDFNAELLLARNYVGGLLVARADALRTAGGWNEGFDGAQDHELVLRLSRTVPRASIQHIPEVLYHARKRSGGEAGLRALREHCEAIGLAAEVSPIETSNDYRVRYRVEGRPLVSIIIPTRDRADLLKQCVESLLAHTRYDAYEIIVADNDSREPETLDYLAALGARGIKVVPCPGAFNFSRINNRAAGQAEGEYILLLNNDIEVTGGEWLNEMLGHAQQPDVGCVGARLWYPDGTLQHGGVILGVGGMAGHAHKHLKRGQTGYFHRAVLPQELSAVTGACLLVRKSIFAEVAGLDEALAVALNDIDFCLKVGAAGYRNIWTPYAELIHHEAKSRGREDTPEKALRFRQEQALMQERWGSLLARDPYYNPHLTHHREDFTLGEP